MAKKGYLNTADVKNGKLCESAMNIEIVKTVKNTIQTVGKNSL
jgi:hypothetical protein